jgi:hypothetical protein
MVGTATRADQTNNKESAMPFLNDANDASLTPTGNKTFPTVFAPTDPGPIPPGILKSGQPMCATPTRQPTGDLI